MRKLIKVFLILICMFFISSCGKNENNNQGDIWDNLGGGGIASDTEESTINPDDAPVNEDVENSDSNKFDNEIKDNIDSDTNPDTDPEFINGIVYINLSNLNTSSAYYSYEDDLVTIENDGIYVLSGTLNGAVEISGSAEKVQVILKGVTINTLDSQSCAAIVFKKNSGERILSVYKDTINNLSDSVGDTAADGDCAVIQAKNSSLVINGEGTLNLKSNGEETIGLKVKKELSINETTININVSDHGIKAGALLSIQNAIIDVVALGDGIKTDVEATTEEECDQFTKDMYAGYIYIYNSSIKVVSGDDGISANSYMKINNTENNIIDITTNNGAPSSITEYSSDNADGKAIRVSGITYVDANDNETDLLSQCEENYYLLILGGTFIINSNDDAVTSKGNLVIDSGNFNIKTGDDGIHAEYITKINNGNITIEKCYEGIEGASVEIYGGTINLVSTDDGINAANADLTNWSYNIYIGGGDVVVNAEGDGVDSNGTIEFAGGTTIIYGPTNGGNGSLDADKGIKVVGGILIALGSSGMVETPSTNSTQCSVVYNMSSVQSGTLSLLDASNNVLLTVSNPKKYQSVVISTPDFIKGSTYTIKVGSLSQSVTISTSSIIIKVGSSFPGPGGPGGPGGGRPR